MQSRTKDAWWSYDSFDEIGQVGTTSIYKQMIACVCEVILSSIIFVVWKLMLTIAGIEKKIVKFFFEGARKQKNR